MNRRTDNRGFRWPHKRLARSLVEAFTSLRTNGSRRKRSTKRLETVQRRALCEGLEPRMVFDASYHLLSGGGFLQDWTNTSLITVDDQWASVPSIMGYRGDGMASPGADPATVLGNDDAPIVHVLANQISPNTLVTGGVAEFEISDPVVALRGNSNADAPYLLVRLNTTGSGNVVVSYRVRDIDSSSRNAPQAVALQYRIGESGAFTNVPAAYVADATAGPGATMETAVSAVLPIAVNNQAKLQLRILTVDTAVEDEWVGIDSLSVTAGSLPVLTASNGTVSGNVLNALSNSGTWSDADGDDVTLTASLGSVIKNSNGTWTWSMTPSQAYYSEPVVITATDIHGGVSTISFVMDAIPKVLTPIVYYAQSGFETAPGGSYVNAMDPSRQVVESGPAPIKLTHTNVVPYVHGITGLVLDIPGLASDELTATEFSFRVGTTDTPSTWANAPNPSSITVIPGNATTAARVRLQWPNGSIKNTWLQVIVQNNAVTGLLERQVFYVGSAVGDVTHPNAASDFLRVTAIDMAEVKNAVSPSLTSVTNGRDLNKDRRVTALDMALAQNLVSSAVVLRLITIPAEGDAAEGEGSGAGGLGWSVSGVGGAPSGIGIGAPTLQSRLTDRVYTVLRPSATTVDASGSYPFSDRLGTTGPIAEPPKEDQSFSTESLDEYFRRLALRAIRL
jgi:hypothetical protein